ncbi:MAG: polysaccharide biosynthesis tyrosine autokinase [Chloroflexota bacterium]|nr:polysaccharide biosynthesis tyrosine autokinase [Chloroflexota bacterium]
MNIDEILPVLRRRWRSFAATFILAVVAVLAVTLSLPKTYRSTATLVVDTKPLGGAIAFDSNLGQQFARTFSTLAANDNVADAVRVRLARGPKIVLTRSELESRMSFAPVEQTQLLQISAEGTSRRQAQTIANVYADEFVRRTAVAFRQGRARTTVKVSEAASTPVDPAKPNPPLYIGLGVLLAFLLACGVAVMRDRLDDRLRIEDSDETVLERPILARVPNIPSRRGPIDRGVVDAFLLLKTNVEYFLKNQKREIAVTSASPREGKTTISANLALAVADDGEQAVIIEADLRRPALSLTPVFRDVPRAPVGLSNYLVNAASEEQIVQEHPDVPNLSVIWSGPRAPSASVLLRSPRMDELILSLLEKFDWVIVDTPPVLLGADASVVAAGVQGTLFVVDAATTTGQSAKVALNQLNMIRPESLGVVLNRALTPDFAGYYGVDDGTPTVDVATAPAEASFEAEDPESLSSRRRR